MSALSRVRWLARHGLAGVLLRREARRGSLDARLMTDPALRADPFQTYDAIRERGLVSKGPFGLVTASHSVCANVLRSETFGVGLRPESLPAPIGLLLRAASRGAVPTPVDPPSMLAVDPPVHTRYRRLVSRVFTARAMESLRPRIEVLAGELLDDLATDAADTVDLVAGYAAQLPVTVIAEILGVPVAMREQLLSWGNGAAVTLDIGISYAEFRRSERDLTAMRAWMLGHFTALRKDPGEDLLSQLVAVKDEDGRLSEDELAATAMLLLGAGFETTVNLIGNGTVQLVAHPEQLERLRGDASLWPNAVEEVLRYDSPVQRTARVAMAPTRLAGSELGTGQLVVALLGGANRDPAVFDNPHRFDVARANAREHLAFSAGVHYCLGAALARLEGEIGLRTLFERFPELSLAGSPTRRGTRVLRGYDEIPVRFNPRNVEASVSSR
jgi:cytochrome P450